MLNPVHLLLRLDYFLSHQMPVGDLQAIDDRLPDAESVLLGKELYRVDQVLAWSIIVVFLDLFDMVESLQELGSRWLELDGVAKGFFLEGCVSWVVHLLLLRV